jgi:fimbrial chaperone protein
MKVRSCLALACLTFVAAQPARAASISISPIRIDVPEPGNSGMITIQNEDARPVNVQVRIFKWSLADGADEYEESDDIVATPPVASIERGGSATVRILRTTNGPIVGEESYRLVVDEIPDSNRVRNLGVNVALRYTIPVFFLAGDASQPKLSWSIRSEGGKRVLAATNSGDKHIRLSAMSLGSVTLAKGLAGYVLGHSTRTWVLPAKAAAARVSADSDSGRLDAPVSR